MGGWVKRWISFETKTVQQAANGPVWMWRSASRVVILDCVDFFKSFAEGAHLSFISERCLAPRRAAMLFVDAERMGISQLKSHRNDTKRLLTLGHSNWTICSLLNWFCSNNFSIFSPASHNKLILYPAEREKEGSNRGRKWGKGNPQKLMTPRGFWPWDIQTGLFAAYQTDFVPKNVRLFPQPPIINQFFILQREEGGKLKVLEKGKGNSKLDDTKVCVCVCVWR